MWNVVSSRFGSPGSSTNDFVRASQFKVSVSLLCLSSLLTACGNDSAFPDQFPHRGSAVFLAEIGKAKDLLNGTNPETIYGRYDVRKLILTATMFDHQGFRNIVHVVESRDTEPQIVVLRSRKIFVEPPHAIEQAPGDHNRRRTNQTAFQSPLKEAAALLAVNLLLRHLLSLAIPDLVGVANEGAPFGRVVRGLFGQFVAQPFVIGIQKCNELSACILDTCISCSGYSPMLLRYGFERISISVQQLARRIPGAVIHDDQLEILKGLGLNRDYGPFEYVSPVIRWDDYTDQWHDKSSRYELTDESVGYPTS